MARILIVDDDRWVREGIRLMVLSIGYNAEDASDLASCLWKARRNRPDLVLCDIKMPGDDGFRVVALLRSDPELRSIPVVMMTGCISSSERDFGREGAQALLMKPFDVKELSDIIQRFTSGPHEDPAE